ncbi:MAG: hypothetical protein GY729_21520 [Desulfobacteraceae bacterium]|nr:hypothetical protein [Desulfobacteraceae bacterium]
MKKISSSIIMIFMMLMSPMLIIAEDRPTPDHYWRQIRKIAQSEFTGMDVAVAINTNYQFDGDNRGAAVGFSMPLYSKKDRMARRAEATGFQQKGAELIKNLEASINQAAIMREACKYLKAKISEEGVEAATAYFDAITKIALHDAETTRYHREIQSLISPFSGKAVIFGTDKEKVVKPATMYQ